MTDSISDMLNAIKIGGTAGKSFTYVPYSKLKHSIADCLLKEGYISSVKKDESKKFPILEIGLAYDTANKSKVNEIKRLSKPSRRFYLGVKSIKNGYGVTILSTPKGIMTGREAKKEMVGGEVLFKMW